MQLLKVDITSYTFVACFPISIDFDNTLSLFYFYPYSLLTATNLKNVNRLVRGHRGGSIYILDKLATEVDVIPIAETFSTRFLL